MIQAANKIFAIGALAPWPFCYLGIPCAPALPVFAFRCTCFGFASCCAVANILPDSAHSTKCAVIRVALMIESVAAFIVTAFWCSGWMQWTGFAFVEHLFQVAGVKMLLDGSAAPHVLFTAVGTALAWWMHWHMVWIHTIPIEEDWAVQIIILLSALIFGMFASGHASITSLRFRARFLYAWLDCWRSVPKRTIEREMPGGANRAVFDAVCPVRLPMV